MRCSAFFIMNPTFAGSFLHLTPYLLLLSNRLKRLLTYGVLLTALSGCEWNPPHDNPLDPNNYRYQPVGDLELLVLGNGVGSPLYGVEVRIPAHNAFAITDSNGIARLENLPVGRWWTSGERRGESPYRRDSVRVDIFENRISRDTLHLERDPAPNGSLRLIVLTIYSGLPIADAEIQIPALGRFQITDNEGVVLFQDLPTGRYWVHAFREAGEGALYQRDSVQVAIEAASETNSLVRLDALPSVSHPTATSLTISLGGEIYRYSVRLKANVVDPDGPTDLERVEAIFIDAAHSDTLTIPLQFDSDSLFWWAEIPSDSFYANSTDNAIFIPFIFKAYDTRGNSSFPQEARLAKVLHRTASIYSTRVNPPPMIFEWLYEHFDDFSDTSLFFLRFRIYEIQVPPILWEDKIIRAREFQSYSDTLDYLLPPADYFCEVWVHDKFGNSSRSTRPRFRVNEFDISHGSRESTW